MDQGQIRNCLVAGLTFFDKVITFPISEFEKGDEFDEGRDDWVGYDWVGYFKPLEQFFLTNEIYKLQRKCDVTQQMWEQNLFII